MWVSRNISLFLGVHVLHEFSKVHYCTTHLKSCRGKQAYSRTRSQWIWGKWNCIRNRSNTHLPRDCRADWHFDFFPASLMLMIWLWMGDLHRVWAIWVQFPSWGWKRIDCPLMVFMGGCFHPDWDIIELRLPLMQSWFCVTISTGVQQTYNVTFVWCGRYTTAQEPHCFWVNMQISKWSGIISFSYSGAQNSYHPVNKDYRKSARQPPMVA